jgi:hypothetical protein
MCAGLSLTNDGLLLIKDHIHYSSLIIHCMENFLFIIREDVTQLKHSQELHQSRIQEMTRWVTGLAESGNYTGGEALKTNGSYVKKETVLTDGPFIEAKECISGFIFINAENMEQAVSIAQTCPYVMDGSTVIEVRSTLVVENKPRVNV